MVKKRFYSADYNFVFDTKTGLFARWGKTLDEDPIYGKFGPEILDIEISTICGNSCPFCYKSNTERGRNMSYETFEKIFSIRPQTLTQIAFGIGDIVGNPDLFKIMNLCRDNTIIPNITINGSNMIPRYYDNLSSVCGAVAVSCYDINTCYNAVNELSNRIGNPLSSVNIHCLLSNETIDKCMNVMKDSMTDKRLSSLSAIVFLWLKPKGKRNTYSQIKNRNVYKELVEFAFDNDIKIGFDSCSAPMFLDLKSDIPNISKLETFVEPCESTLFSYYINVDGIGFPCSFAEGCREFKGINVLKAKNFDEIWNNKTSVEFRDKLLRNNRNCPIYKLGVYNEDKKQFCKQ